MLFCRIVSIMLVFCLSLEINLSAYQYTLQDTIALPSIFQNPEKYRKIIDANLEEIMKQNQKEQDILDGVRIISSITGLSFLKYIWESLQSEQQFPDMIEEIAKLLEKIVEFLQVQFIRNFKEPDWNNILREKLDSLGKKDWEIMYVDSEVPGIVTYTKDGQTTIYITKGIKNLLEEEKTKISEQEFRELLEQLMEHEVNEYKAGGITYHEKVLNGDNQDKVREFLKKVETKIQESRLKKIDEFIINKDANGLENFLQTATPKERIYLNEKLKLDKEYFGQDKKVLAVILRYRLAQPKDELFTKIIEFQKQNPNLEYGDQTFIEFLHRLSGCDFEKYLNDKDVTQIMGNVLALKDKVDINTSEDLEGTVIHKFISLHILLLGQLLFDLLKNGEKSQFLVNLNKKMEQDKLEKKFKELAVLIARELAIALEIRRNYVVFTQTHESGYKCDNDLIKAEAENIVEQVSEMVDEEYVVPAGWVRHRIYVVFRILAGKFSMRIDNLGDGCDKHEKNYEERFPYTYTSIDPSQITQEQKQKLISYIEKIFNAKREEGATAIQKIYSPPTQNMQPITNSEQLADIYPSLDEQKAGNCTAENYFAGMYMRLGSSEFFDIVKSAEAPMLTRLKILINLKNKTEVPQQLPIHTEVNFQIGEPPFYVKPAKNLKFIGREKELADIRRELVSTKAGEAAVIATAGLGGIGKTQLAVEYAYRYRQDYAFVAYLDAEPNMIFGSFVELAKNLNIAIENIKGNEEEIKRQVKNYLQNHPGWLLVFDNVESESQIKDYLPTTGGHMLITTRRSDFTDTRYKVLNLEQFTKEEAREYIRKTANTKEDDKVLDELSDELGSLPLALSHACAYINEEKKNNAQYGIADYLKEYKKQKQAVREHRKVSEYEHVWVSKNDFEDLKIDIGELWSKLVSKEYITKYGEVLKKFKDLAEDEENGYDKFNLDGFSEDQKDNIYRVLCQFRNTVDISLSMSISKIQANRNIPKIKQNIALDILNFIAYLAPNDIPITLIEACIKDKYELSEATVEIETKEAIALLEAYSLINKRRGDGMVNVHRLVQEVARHRLNGKETNTYLEKIINNLVEEIKYYYHNPDTWSESKLKIKHSKIVWEYAMSIGIQTKNLGILLCKIGKYTHYTEEKYQEALEYFINALKIQKRVYQSVAKKDFEKLKLNTDNIWDALTQNDWINKEGIIQPKFKALGDKKNVVLSIFTKKQIGMIVSVLIQTLYKTEEQAEVGRTLNCIGQVLLSQEKYQEALEYYNNALEIFKRAGIQECHETAILLSFIGQIFQIQHKYRKALKYCTKALKTQKRVYKTEEHPQVTVTLNIIGQIFLDKKKYKKALKYYTKSLEIKKQVYRTEKHISIIATLNSIGQVFLAEGKYQEAQDVEQKALDISINLSGEEHPSTQIIRKKLDGIKAKLKKSTQYSSELSIIEKSQFFLMGIVAVIWLLANAIDSKKLLNINWIPILITIFISNLLRVPTTKTIKPVDEKLNKYSSS